MLEDLKTNKGFATMKLEIVVWNTKHSYYEEIGGIILACEKDEKKL